MSSFKFKKLLLAGSTLLAVSSVSFAAQAQSTIDVSVSDTYGDGDAGELDTSNLNTGGMGGDALNITGDGVLITIQNDGTNADGNGFDAFNVGAVTDNSTANDGALTVQTGGNAANLTVTIDSVQLDGNMLVQNRDGDDDSNNTTVTNNLVVGGTLNVTNNETSTGDTVNLSVGGDLDVTGTTTITGGTFAGSNAGLTVSGTSVNFGGGLVLQDQTGTTTLTLDGAAIQTVNGTIDGGSDNEGTIAVTGAGAIFTDTIGNGAGNVGAINANDNEGGGTVITFQAGVEADGGINLGDGGGAGDTYEVVFDGTTAGFDVDAVVSGAAVDDTNILVRGGNTIVQTATHTFGAGGNINNLIISGSGTRLDSNATIRADAITLGAGSILEMNADVRGDIDGAGTLDVDTTSAYRGNIGDTTALLSVTVAAGQALTIDGQDGNTTLNANDIELEGAGATLNIDASGNTFNIEGPITAAVGGQGVVNLNDTAGTGTYAITADIGETGTNLATLTVGGAGTNETVTTTGSLYVDAITLDDADVLQFIGTGSTQIVAGTIQGLGDTDGIITVGNGGATTVQFNGLVGDDAGDANDVGAFNVLAAAEAIFNTGGVSQIDGAVDNDGTIQINAGDTLITTAAYNSADAAAGVWQIGVNRTAGTTSAGIFRSPGVVDLSLDSVEFIVEATSQPLVAGTIASVFDGGAGPVVTAASVTDNSFLYDLTLAVNGNGQDLDLVIAVANDITDAAGTTGAANAGNELLGGLGTSTNAQVNEVQGRISGASSAEEIADILEAVTTEVAGGAVIAGFTVASQATTVTNTRLASLRNGDTVTSMSAGDLTTGIKVWSQAFGQLATQDERDSVKGYDAKTYGLIAGIDTQQIADNLTLGLAAAFGNTIVESDATDKAETEVNSYQFSIYGDYAFNDRTYLAGQVGYIFADNETERQNVGGVSGLEASGDFESNVYLASVELGHDYSTESGVTLTPHITADYMHYTADDYTETGAGGVSVINSTDDMDVFELGLGVDATWRYNNRDGSYTKPEVRFGVRHDFVSDKFEGTNQFAAGGSTAFKVEGFEPADTTFDFGTGVTYFSTDNWEFSANYDFEIKSDYDSHTGSLKGSYKF